MATEFYEQKIENVLRQIEKFENYISERELTIHMLNVMISEEFTLQHKSMDEMEEDYRKVQKEIGGIQSQIEFFQNEIETLREKQYYLIQWKNKCCGCEHCNSPKTSADVKAAASKRLNEIVHKLEKEKQK